MSEGAGTFRPDGSCWLAADHGRDATIWPSVADWAADWFTEWQAGAHGPATEFAHAACDDALPGVVDALVALADVADGDEELLSWVGAGPLEDLVSHSGHGLRVLTEVDAAAHRNPAFRAALRFTWLGADVPATVRERLGVLGARLLGGG